MRKIYASGLDQVIDHIFVGDQEKFGFSKPEFSPELNDFINGRTGVYFGDRPEYDKSFADNAGLIYKHLTYETLMKKIV
jgi:hypothetical protein